jgi:hypothetical protein
MDFPLLQYQEVARVVGLDFFNGGFSLDIKGTGFQGISAVLINGVRSPVYVVLNDSHVIADIPESELGSPIRTLNVLKISQADYDASIISFESLTPSSQSNPSNEIVQFVLKYLFTSPGSDIFTPNAGGGLLSILGTDPQRSSQVGLIEDKVRAALSALRRAQSRRADLPSSRRVRNIELLGSSFDSTSLSLDIRLRIVAEDGNAIVAGLSV